MAALGPPKAMAFPQHERKILLATPGIGPAVIQRLEQAGFDSLSSLHACGLDRAIAIICRQVGSHAWLNRRRSLVRALETAAQNPAST